MDRIVIAQERFLGIIACAAKDVPKEEIEEFVNTKIPTGIRSKWQIDEEGDRAPVKCDDDPDRIHYVLIC